MKCDDCKKEILLYKAHLCQPCYLKWLVYAEEGNLI